MLPSYFNSPKNIRTKKIQKTNKPTNKQSTYHQTRQKYTKNEERKLKPIPCEKISCLHQSLTFLFFKKKSRVFSVTRKQHVSNIKRTSYHY